MISLRTDISGNFLLKSLNTLNNNGNGNHSTNIANTNTSDHFDEHINIGKQDDYIFISQLFCDIVDILKSENISRVYIN